MMPVPPLPWVERTTAGRPPRASAQARISSWSVVTFALAISVSFADRPLCRGTTRGGGEFIGAAARLLRRVERATAPAGRDRGREPSSASLPAHSSAQTPIAYLLPRNVEGGRSGEWRSPLICVRLADAPLPPIGRCGAARAAVI